MVATGAVVAEELGYPNGPDVMPEGEEESRELEELDALASRGHAVVLFCTEVPGPFEVADRLDVLIDGRVSEPLLVHAYDRVEALAADVSKLERHAEGAVAV